MQLSVFASLVAMCHVAVPFIISLHCCAVSGCGVCEEGARGGCNLASDSIFPMAFAAGFDGKYSEGV